MCLHVHLSFCNCRTVFYIQFPSPFWLSCVLVLFQKMSMIQIFLCIYFIKIAYLGIPQFFVQHHAYFATTLSPFYNIYRVIGELLLIRTKQTNKQQQQKSKTLIYLLFDLMHSTLYFYTFEGCTFHEAGNIILFQYFDIYRDVYHKTSMLAPFMSKAWWNTAHPIQT